MLRGDPGHLRRPTRPSRRLPPHLCEKRGDGPHPPEIPIGAIGLYWAKSRTTSDEELALLQGLANTTAVAMENVQIYTELEQRVARRAQELEALNTELEAFSYSVSHDLRAPLRAVNGFSELLASDLGNAASAKTKRYLGLIRDGGTKMGVLIEDLLKLSRVARQEVRRIDVNLAEMAREIAQRLRTEEPARQVEIVIPDKLAARCDAGLMAVVMENFLSNAWKYTGRTARARIEVGCRQEADGTVTFFVQDNGAGFDSAKASDLFRPFYRMHTVAKFPGTGVGLVTVQRIIHRHGGRIWAAAQPGRGATFSFTCNHADGDPAKR